MKRYVWLSSIILLAGILRIWNLNSYPPGFTPDEAAFGYNAYSLLKTGRDEWGQSFYRLPVTNLESFGDYKLPLYAFLVVPSVLVFGLSEFAIRLPSALFGILSVPVMYVLAKKVFSQRYVGLCAALLTAISPWGVSLSRGAFEANLVILLLPLFLTLIIKKQNLLAAMVLGLNFYSYHSARFISLALLLFFLLKFRSKLFLTVFTLLLFLPGMFALLGSGGVRSSDVSILSPTDSWMGVSDRRFEAVQSGLPDLVSRSFSNKLTYLVTQFVNNYLSYFSSEFLFTQGARESSYGMVPGLGVIYPFEIFTIICAVFFLIKQSRVSKFHIALFLLLLVSIIPASLSKGPGFAANRALPELPFLILFSSFGLATIFKYLPKFLIYIIIGISLINFLETYFYHNRSLYRGMLYGRREMVSRITSLSKAYQNIQISKSLSEPHIYFAFYNQIDPKIYQSESINWKKYHSQKLKFLDQYDGYYLGSLRFGALKLDQKNTLFAGLPEDFPGRTLPMFQIDYPDGTPAIYVIRQ